MNRKLRTLGLALFAAFAMSAVAASGASAAQDHFTSNDDLTHLTAKATNAQEIKFSTPASDKLTCNQVNVKGSIAGSEVTEITLQKIYNGCTATKGGTNFSATVTDNGCHSRLTADTTSTATPGQHATVHLECPGEVDGIEIDVTAFKIPCINIPPQTLHGARYRNDDLNPNAIEIETTVHGIDSEETETTACNENTNTDGQCTGNVTVEGFKNAGHTDMADLSVVET